MDKNPPKEKESSEEVDIIIESQQWEHTSAPRFTWRHGLLVALILGGAILFAFGFLIIAAVVIIAAIVINIIAFIIRKLT